MTPKKTICFFGFNDFDPAYARNRVLIAGLKQNNQEVVLCRTSAKGVKGACKLIKEFNSVKKKFDLVIVGYSDCRWPVLVVKLLFRKLVVWDAFYSVYDAYVYDRQLIKPGSVKAIYHWFIEWLNCLLADKILLDTDTHIDYFVKTFLVSRKKFIKALIGSDPNLFHSTGEVVVEKKFVVHFHGKFIPLQGVDYIIKAAKILENDRDILFQIIGNGQTYQQARQLANNLQLKNVSFIGPVNLGELPGYIARADICLGIFGETAKTQRVIPNKIYEAMALAKPVITAATPAIAELFADQENIVLCRISDAEDLAAKILMLKNNPQLREKIGRGGYKLYLEHCRPVVIGKKLLADLGII